MDEQLETDYVDDANFREFISREFRNMAKEACVEELAEFAFGDLLAAIEAFKKERKMQK